MTSLGRISGALTSINNENTAALASLNFDFTLIKLEAPSEFRGIGNSLSKSKKENAEEGKLHRVARKLGALFGTILPPTENLLRAYGKRSSDIATPRKAKSTGIFASFLGPDSTSIWAAATSGRAAISVHLLACILARAWSGPEATSIWVELVEIRKQEILKEVEMNLAQIVAAKQEISREELAAWDSSARAWLQTGDEAMIRQQKQLMLVLDNCALKVKPVKNLYTSVIKTWTTSLSVMENLITGIPQRVNDGAILMAISGWHLYPEMSVVGLADLIKQEDPFVDSLGILTIGLGEKVDGGINGGVFWSLPLACLKYYGKPVRATGLLGRESARLAMDEFSFVLLGCVFSTWKGFAATPDVGVQWLLQISRLLRAPEREPRPQAKDLSRMREITSKASWVGLLLDAAKRFNDLGGAFKLETARRLVYLGNRRSTFLCADAAHPPPLFGLSKFSTLFSLFRGPENRIALLRKLGRYLNLTNDRFVIRYFVERGGVRSCEYTTLFPVENVSPGKLFGNLEGKEVFSNGSYIRWLPYQQSTGSQAHNTTLRRQATDRLGEKSLPIVWTPRVQDFRDDKDYDTSLAKILSDVPQTDDRLPNPKMGLFAGDESSASIMCIKTIDVPTNPNLIELHADSSGIQVGAFSNAKFLSTALQPSDFDYDNLTRWFISFHGGYEDFLSGLKAAASVAEVYKLLPDATIAPSTLKQPLTSAKWVPRVKWSQYSSLNYKLSKEEVFACIAMFDNGDNNLDPVTLTQVFGLATGNSLFIANQLLCDPHEAAGTTEIRRVTGNIGRDGLSFFIPPPKPETADPDVDQWMEIDQLPYTGVVDDSFQKTSLHISFTAYEMPLQSETDGHLIDKPIRLVETVIAVHDRERWIADLDIMSALTSNTLSRLLCKNVGSGDQACKRVTNFASSPDIYAEVFWDMTHPLVSTTNLDEFLDLKEGCVRVIHAHENWLARLALATLSVARGHKTLLMPPRICWSCCKAVLAESQSDILIL